MWEGLGDRTELQHIDPHSYGHQRFFPILLGCSTGSLGSHSAGCWFSQPPPTRLIPNSSGYHSLSFPFSWAAQPGAWGPASLGAGFLYRILPPTRLIPKTDWISWVLNNIIVQRPPSCGRHKSHSFNPSTVKVIFWYSSNGCTCYWHRYISYFDSTSGSWVNIQHL